MVSKHDSRNLYTPCSEVNCLKFVSYLNDPKFYRKISIVGIFRNIVKLKKQGG